MLAMKRSIPNVLPMQVIGDSIVLNQCKNTDLNFLSHYLYALHLKNKFLGSGNNRPILLGTLQLFPLACRPAVCRSECCSSSLFEYTVSDGKNIPLNFKGGINEALSLIDFASSTVFVLSLRFCLLLYDSFSHLEFGSRSHIVNILDIVF